eukprot:391601-Prymnesium_polylepis.1
MVRARSTGAVSAAMSGGLPSSAQRGRHRERHGSRIAKCGGASLSTPHSQTDSLPGSRLCSTRVKLLRRR